MSEPVPSECPVHGPAAFAAEQELEHIHRHIETIQQLLAEVLEVLDERLPPRGPRRCR